MIFVTRKEITVHKNSAVHLKMLRNELLVHSASLYYNRLSLPSSACLMVLCPQEEDGILTILAFDIKATQVCQPHQGFALDGCKLNDSVFLRLKIAILQCLL